MTPAETARWLLTDSPGEALCDACLAFTCSTSLTEIRHVTVTLLKTDGFQQAARCEGCRRSVAAIAFLPKCARCSYPIETRQDAVLLNGDIVHTVCLRMLDSEETIRTSRNLTTQSKHLVERARRQIGKKPPEPCASDVASIATERVRRILVDAPGDPLCELCLMAAAQCSVEDTHAATESLLANAEEFKRGYTCAGCHRSVTSIFYLAKCADCGVRLHDGGTGFRMGEEIFHVRCLRRLIADDSTPVSRAFGRRCRRLIDQARRRLSRGYEGPPLESP